MSLTEQNPTRYSLMKTLVEGLAEIDVTEETLAVTIGKMRRDAKRVLNMKEAPRNTDLAAAQAKGRQLQDKAAQEFRATIMPHIEEAKKQGYTTTRAIAKYLNDHGIVTSRGGHWQSSTVYGIINR